jgi:minichromosomal maintenance factor (ISS)
MCNNNLQSVEVSFVDLSMVQPQIAIWLADEPSILIDCFNTVFLPLSPPV